MDKTLLVESPEVRYARSGDVSIAYQVVGNGPVDLVFVPFLLSMIFAWLHPLYVGFFERLASFSRLILFDKRGTGASDRPRGLPTLEAQMDDVRAVLDAAGSERAALFGAGHGALMCALFAATYPERTSQLVTWNIFPRLPGSTEEHRELIKRAREEWGQPDSFDKVIREQYPSLADDQSFRRVLPTIIRASASPGSAVEFNRMLTEADISEILPAIRVPTLLLYPRIVGTKSDLLPLRDLEEQTEQVALAIPDARVVGIPGPDHNPFVAEEVTAEVRRFLTEREAEPVPDRVLATVLFTDIVGSTERASALGDQAWRKLIADHRLAVRRQLARFGGNEIDTAGDGFFATFDGPARGIACAAAIALASAEQGLQVRLGLHTGECERDGTKVTGIAVHIGARVASLARPGEVLVSRTVKDLVAGSGIEFEGRGEHELKGVPGEWRLYAVRDE
jgi:class 3 adenylate cyclase